MKMEIQFKRDQINCFSPVLHTTMIQEETMEMIVPDACPDILRIADTEGIVCIRSKEAKTGAAQIDGIVKTTVLYVPDGMTGLQKLPMQIPFSWKIENTNMMPQMALQVRASLVSAETRVMNPRKVFVALQISLQIQGMVSDTIEFCTDIEAESDVSLQILKKEQTVWTMTGIGEKAFQFSDQMHLPSGKPEMEELLNSRVSISGGDAKIVGTKLIFKGEVQAHLFYRSTAGSLQTTDYTFPYSQIMEMKGVQEDASCSVSVILTDCSIGAETDEEGSRFVFSMGFLAQAQAWEAKSISFLSDLYSTSCTAVPQIQNYVFHSLRETGENRKSRRESMETAVLPKSVLDTYILTGAVAQMQEGEEKVFSVDTQVFVLYLGEDNQIYTTSLRTAVEERVVMDPQKVCMCRAVCPGEIFATPTSVGIEVRYPVDFLFETLTDVKMAGVWDVTLEEREQQETRPSVVLRMTEAGEQIWNLAKQYDSTVEEICAANHLEGQEAELPAGRLLLIPHRR